MIDKNMNQQPITLLPFLLRYGKYKGKEQREDYNSNAELEGGGRFPTGYYPAREKVSTNECEEGHDGASCADTEHTRR